MSPLEISITVFGCILIGTIVGVLLRNRLPDHHIAPESRDGVKLAVGLISTMAALVLGLLVASAKSAYDTQKNEITQMSAKLILLDRALRHFGPEAEPIRKELRHSVERALAQIWATDGSADAKLEPTSAEAVLSQIERLAPKTDSQRTAQARAHSLASDLEEARWLLYEQTSSSISLPFLVVLVIWLTLIFGGFGLLAPRNTTVLAMLVLCGLSVASSITLILEMDRPFSGLIQISPQPLKTALAQMQK